MRTPSLLLAASLLLEGCAAAVPVGKYEAFSHSTQSLSATVTETFGRIERLQRRFTVTTALDAPLTPESFQPRVGSVSYDLTPELLFRESALKVVARYAGVLQALAMRDEGGGVDQASLDLAASVRGFAEQSAGIQEPGAAETAGILGTLVDVVGRQVLEGRRIRGLKTAMDTAQRSLDSLAPLIARSTEKLEGAVDLMRDRILAHANTTRPAYTASSRFAFDEEIAGFLEEVNAIHASLQNIDRAVMRIPDAHREIRKALDDPATVPSALTALIEECRRAGALFNQMNTN